MIEHIAKYSIHSFIHSKVAITSLYEQRRIFHKES